MRHLFSALAPILVSIPLIGHAQTPAAIPIDSAKRAFALAHSLCSADAGKLWGVSLCGPIMFVDAPSRSVVASEGDAKGALTAKDGAFVGVLPGNMNIANTAVEWSGVKWTQMLWPLPDDEHLRATLIVHELFHRIQNQLGLPNHNAGENAHLDEMSGRYYLQLEWRALARALEAGSDAPRRAAARDALGFRAARYRLYPKAATEEQALEQNEGLAEYTGVRVGNPTAALRTKMALHDLSSHVGDATFVRSFAYGTGPAYGLLLDRYAPGWRGRLPHGEGLDAMLGRALHVAAAASEAAIAVRAASYDGATLHAAEKDRDAKRQQLLALNRAKFVDGPILTVKFRKMNVQFDPRNLQPLGDAGTVYPTIRISDEWGVLEGKNGALMKADWSALVVAAPASVPSEGSSVSGDGWTLALAPGWRIVPGARAGDFVLSPPP